MGKFAAIALLASAIAAASFPSSARATDGPAVFAPSAAWSSGTDGESCWIARRFGGADGVTFTLQSFSPGGSRYKITLRGKPLPQRDSGALEFETRFNPDIEATSTFGVLSSGGKLPQLTFTAGLESASVLKAMGQGEPAPAAIDTEREAAVDEFVISFSRGRPLSLQLGSMAQPLTTLRECTAGLVEKWGLDPAVQRSLSRPAVPIDQEKWLGSGTYPWEYLRTYRSAVVQVRLITDEKGAATQCVVQSPRAETHAGVIGCRELMKTARFEPALDAAGKPVTSYYTTAIIYQTRRRNGNW